MTLRDRLTGTMLQATISIDHAAPSYRGSVLAMEGEALGTIDAAAFEISEATDDERLALARGGYRLAEHRRDNGGAS